MTDQTNVPKCSHAYYDRTALTSMCDYNCKQCDGYDQNCNDRDADD